jgi:predicted ATPase
LVFELEDAQWLDAASQELLAVVGRTARDYPLLLVITARYADDGSRPDFGLKNVPELRLDLDALGRQELRALAHARLGAPPSNSLLEHLVEKTGGNPFFVEQTLLDLQERKALTFREEGWAILSDRLGELPETINALLIARIDRLSTPVQEAVKAAAVLGREFEVRVLSEMLKEESLEAPLGNLVREAERQEIWIRL